MLCNFDSFFVTIQPSAKKYVSNNYAATQDNRGAPLSAAKIASMTFKLFFLMVDMYALILQKATAPSMLRKVPDIFCCSSVSYTHLRAHETKANLVCRLLLE